MAFPPASPSLQLEERLGLSRTPVQDISLFPERSEYEKGHNDVRYTAESRSQLSVRDAESCGLSDLVSADVWRSRAIWRAGIIEGITAGSLNFVSGLMVATLSKWPVATIPAGIFFGNTALVTILICATVTATGAHINSIVTISVAFSGLCSPVRAIVYLVCHLVGGSLGGAIVRASIGETLAHEIHNGGCWIEPGGAVSVWQAALIEFGCCFVLLFLGYGVGLDPRQAKLFGIKYAPVLVGLLVGLMTSITGTLYDGYSGAGMFPGRCFGLAVGIGELQSSHWVWWIPDILAAALYSLLYKLTQPYANPHFGPTV